MLALRFGSYSMAATVAGTPSLSRRKSTTRYCFLCPPPRCHTTISPRLLRPPVRFFGSSNFFSGVCLVISLLSSMVMKRRDAVYGLKLFSAIVVLLSVARPAGPRQDASESPPRRNSGLQVLRVLDHLLAGRQLDVRLLPVPPVSFRAAAAAELSVKDCRAHSGHLHLENLLHRFFDLCLGRAGGDLEHDRVLRFLHAKPLFGDDGPANHLERTNGHCLSLGLLLLAFLAAFLLGRGLFRGGLLRPASSLELLDRRRRC